MADYADGDMVTLTAEEARLPPPVMDAIDSFE